MGGQCSAMDIIGCCLQCICAHDQLVPAVWPEPGMGCKDGQWWWCLTAGTVRDSVRVVTWGAGSEQVIGAGMTPSVARAALGGGPDSILAQGGAMVQAASRSQVTTSLPAVTCSRDGFEVLPTTPDVWCCRCWARVDESAPPPPLLLVVPLLLPC